MPSVRRVNWAKFRVSMVCLVAMLILLTLIYLLTGGELLQPKATVYMFVPDATGLIKDSPVRVDGIGVGKVASVKLTGSPIAKRAIQVNMTITRDRLSSIPVDSFAQLSTDNLIGDKYVDVTSGKAENHIRAEGEISFKDQPDLMKSLDLSDFEKELRDVDATLTQIEQGNGLVGEFVMGEQVYDSLLKQLQQFHKQMQSIASANTSLGQALYSADMYRQIREPIAEIDRNLAQIQSGQGSNGELFRGTAQYEQLRANTRSLLRSVTDIRSGEMMSSDRLYQDWNRNLSALIRTVEEMNANPALNRTDAYESLNGMAKEMTKGMKDFREHPSKYLRLKVF